MPIIKKMWELINLILQCCPLLYFVRLTHPIKQIKMLAWMPSRSIFHLYDKSYSVLIMIPSSLSPVAPNKSTKYNILCYLSQFTFCLYSIYQTQSIYCTKWSVRCSLFHRFYVHQKIVNEYWYISCDSQSCFHTLVTSSQTETE